MTAAVGTLMGLFVAVFGFRWALALWAHSLNPVARLAAPDAASEEPLTGMCLCTHRGFDHSRVLADSPCLDCACPAFMKDVNYRRGPRYVDDGGTKAAFVPSLDRLWASAPDPEGAE